MGAGECCVSNLQLYKWNILHTHSTWAVYVLYSLLHSGLG
jgi:hypothetical protein